MKLQMLSFNARGLNDEAAVTNLQSYIRNSIPVPDIVAIQETKLQGGAASYVGGRIWRPATCFSLDATPGYGYDPTEPGAGCGGIMIFIHPRWARKIGASGLLLDNQGHWFVLQGLPGGDIGFVNLYAPNESPARCLLLESLARDLSRTCRWLVMGDFNMVEHRADKTRQCPTMIPHRERLLFNAMKSALQVEDHPRSANSLRFSWDNNPPQEARTLARLDRLYIFNAEANNAD